MIKSANAVWMGLLAGTLAWGGAAPSLEGQESSTYFEAPDVVADQTHRFEALADLDGDNDLDIISVWKLTSTSVKVAGWINGGATGLTEGWEYTTTVPDPNATIRVLPGDFNGDGRDDFVFAVGPIIAFRLSVGATTPPALGWAWQEATPILGLAAHDYDGNGMDDLVVTRNGEIKIYQSSASAPALVTNAGLPFDGRHEVLLADLNGDTTLDICVAHRGSATTSDVRLVMFEVFGMSLFPIQTQVLTNLMDPRTTSGDIDGDGDLDLVVFHGSNQYTIVRRNGATGFSVDPPRTGGPATHLADLDGDGDLDGIQCDGVLASSLNLGASTFRMSLNDGTGQLGPSFTFAALGADRLAGVTDIDGDGDQDLIAGRCIYYARPAPGSPPFIHGATFTHPRQIVDMDRDGDPDVKVALDSIHKNSGDGLLSSENQIVPPAPVGFAFQGPGIPGDFDGDGDLDLIVKMRQGNSFVSMRLLRNQGAGNFVDAGTPGPVNVDFCRVPSSSIIGFAFEASPENSLVVDLDGDGDRDLITRARGLASVPGGVSRIWWNAGAGSFTSGPEYPQTYIEHVAEVTGDGLLDFIGPRSQLGLFLYPGLAPGLFATAGVSISATMHPHDGSAIGDLNGDGVVDIVAFEGAPELYLGDGMGGFTQSVTLPGPSGLNSSSGTASHVDLFMHMEDLDGDGELELVGGPLNFAPGCSAIFSRVGPPGTTFEHKIQVVLPRALADMDGDGDADAVEQTRIAWNTRHRGLAAGFRRQYGAGVPGLGGVTPTLGNVGPYRPGLSGEIRITGGIGVGAGLLLLSNAPANIPAAGGTVLVAPQFLIPFVLNGAPGFAGAGSWSLPWTLPPGSGGITFYHQAGILDSNAPQGVSMTNAMLITVGL